jgi:hypothetical protein
MSNIIRCDGNCGRESPDPKTGSHIANGWTKLLIKKCGHGFFRRHVLCEDCTAQNIFIIECNGEIVSDHGFASDVLK